MMKLHAGVLCVAILLTGCGSASSTDLSVERELMAGRGPIRTMNVNVYEFPMAEVPENMADWQPGENDITVISSVYEFDRNGWLVRMSLVNRENEPYQLLRQCETKPRNPRRCQLWLPPSDAEFGKAATYVDMPDGFRQQTYMDDEPETMHELRVWLDRDARIVHSEDRMGYSGKLQPEVNTRMERHLDPNGNSVLKIERGKDKPETRVTYEYLVLDAFGNSVRRVERQDPAFPDPGRRPDTLRLQINEYEYYDGAGQETR